MAPNGVGYRKSNSLRKVPEDEDSPMTIGRRVLSGREERERFLDVVHGRCASSARQRLRGKGWQFSLVFWVDWLRSAERSEPKEDTVIVPVTVPRIWRLRQSNPGECMRYRYQCLTGVTF